MDILKNNWIKIIIVFVFLITLFSCAINVQARNLQDAFLVDDGSVSDLLDQTAGRSGYDIRTKDDHLNPIFKTTINIALSFLGIVFIILMVYGGILWMTDQGNEEQVKKAKDLIISAVIGLIIVLAAYAITWLIITVLADRTLKEPTEISNNQ